MTKRTMFEGTIPLDNQPEPASVQEKIIPLNSIDDPFIGLTDEQLGSHSLALQEAVIVRLLVEDLTRGLYSVGRIREKYLGNENYSPYPWLTPEKLSELLKRAVDRMVADNPIDVRYEIAGYLSSNLKLQESLYDMLDITISEGKTRTSVEIARTLNAMKKDRIDFIERTGIRLSEEAKDPNKPSLLPPGVTPVTNLLSEGANILERTIVPDKYKGVLGSGDIAQSKRDGETSGDMEEQQDSVHTASLLPV